MTLYRGFNIIKTVAGYEWTDETGHRHIGGISGFSTEEDAMNDIDKYKRAQRRK